MDPRDEPEEENLFEREMLAIRAARLGVPYVDDADLPLDRAAASLVPLRVLIRHVIVPLARRGEALLVATQAPQCPFARQDVEAACGLRTEFIMARPSAIRKALRRLSQAGPPSATTSE